MERFYTVTHPFTRRVRLSLISLIGLLIGLFFATFLTAAPAHAADANWNGRDIVYNNKTYTPSNNTAKNEKLGVPNGSLVYINQSGNDVNVIYFPAGDVNSLSSANHASYSFTPPDTYTKKGDSSTVSIESPSENTTSSTCDVQGLGWFICPVANWLAQGMDWMYEKLAAFLKTQPLETTNKRSGLYIAWDVMRNFANMAFIAAFLIIIYSQMTSVGISNYGIKRLLPRLIIAAVAVNLSFYICAILVDISNIAGYALQDIFMNIKNTVSSTGTTTVNTSTWTAIVSSVLSNGAFFAGLAVAGGVLGTELLPFVLPLLVGLSLTLLLVLLIMAARQALIIILIIISPLAFVCYLLPGTEQWFKKWQSTFTTMLIFFPAFAVAFGGAQLAGIIIIQNAGGENGAIMQILGLAVQAAPLLLTPLILKLSGGVLNRIAGMVNDKNKGLFDRSKNWAKEKSELRKHQKYNSKRRPISAARRKFGDRGRKRRADLESYRTNTQALYEGSARGRRQALFNSEVADKAALAKEQNANAYEEIKAGYTSTGIERTRTDRLLRRASSTWSTRQDLKQQEAADQVRDLSRQLALEGMRKSNAQRAQNKQLAEAILNNNELQKQAAGNVYVDENGNNLGMDAALATAIATTRSETGKSIDEAQQIMKHFKMNSSQRQTLAKGGVVEIRDSAGRVIRRFDNNSPYLREAAIEEQIKVGTVAEVAELVSVLGPEYRGTVSSALAASGVKGKAPFMGGKLIDDIIKGDVYNRDTLDNYIASWLAGGKFKAEDIAVTDPQGIQLLKEALMSTHGGSITNERRRSLKDMIDTVLTDRELSSKTTDEAKIRFRDLKNML